jgi:hypothetical protein
MGRSAAAPREGRSLLPRPAATATGKEAIPCFKPNVRPPALREAPMTLPHGGTTSPADAGLDPGRGSTGNGMAGHGAVDPA